MQTDSKFTSRIGFILAASGSAVGLGNIWRFPYLAAQYGGGVFLFTYLILAITFGYALLLSENCIGRMTGKSPIGAYQEFCAGKQSFLKSIRIGGYINAIVPLIIVPYYCVIGGWITKYIVAMILNPIAKFSKDSVISAADGSTSSWSGSYFVNFITSPVEPVIYFLIFAAMVAVVVAFGVQKGVERSSKILMPMLVILILAICVYCFFIPGASAGLTYYFRPDFMKFSYMTVVAAMGQLFYSLSLAMGIMITYGSYMRKEDDLISSVNHVEIFDTAISFLAGLMIIPALVAFGGEEAARSAGPGLVFVTMPQVFADFPGGQFFAILFFVLVLFAAVTSAVSLLETNVHTFCEQFKLSRKNSIVICVLEIVVLGTLTVLGYSVLSNVHPLFFIEKFKNLDILDSMDTVSNYILMPIGAIFTTLLVTAVIGLDKFSNEIQQQGKWYRKYIYQFCMCLVVIPCLLIILLNSLGIIK